MRIIGSESFFVVKLMNCAGFFCFFSYFLQIIKIVLSVEVGIMAKKPIFAEQKE